MLDSDRSSCFLVVQAKQVWLIGTRGQEELEERKNIVRSRLHHTYMEYRNLMGERLRLLECYTPINAAAFHGRVVNLLSERMSLLERCKLGGRGSGGS